MLALRNERRVSGMVGCEKLRPLREELETVDVAESPAQRQRREQGKQCGAAEKASHDAEVYASGQTRLFLRVVLKGRRLVIEHFEDGKEG